MVLLLSLMAILPSLTPKVPVTVADTLKLGLDLQGGVQLLLEIDFDNYYDNLMQQNLSQARKIMRTKHVSYQRLRLIKNYEQRQLNTILIKLKDVDGAKEVQKVLQQELSQLSFELVGSELSAKLASKYIVLNKQQVVSQSLEIIRNRVDEFGNKEISLQTVGSNRFDLQVPGLDDPEELKQLIGKTAKLTFHLVNEAMANSADKLPANSKRLMLSGEDAKLVVFKDYQLSGEMLTDAQATFQQGRPVVSFKLNSIGAKLFAELTKANVNKRFAIVLDDKVISAPVVREPIAGGASVISGSFTAEEAANLALLLRAGALPAPLKIVEERTLGPSLGMDAIESGVMSTVVSFLAVVIFMLAIYGWFGAVASIALLANVIILFAVLSWFGSTITLPGIAGIVLTVGMAVDANVHVI
ncbi:MAG: protein translocase subunit SecD [Pseudomonadota bacterium]